MLIATLAMLVLFVGLTLSFRRKVADLKSRVSGLEQEKQGVEARARAAEEEAQSLSRYRLIVSAELEATRIVTDAQSAAHAMRNQADVVFGTASRQADALVSEARTSAATLVSQARSEAVIASTAAAGQAADVVARANAEAQQVAGNALEAQRNVEVYRREIQALENVIEGYGDKYVVPAHSVLDDLADAFGFAEAGDSLKKARDRSRFLVTAGKAATCAYVEDNRRETAIRFVIDAFNGKIDTVLALVKDENVGTLRQRILDAFSLVNKNGGAFRGARIFDEYLQSRLEELRWAAAVIELKDRQREEQRHIKEQMREEEKARREYERAVRDAQKEEEALRKAMEKVQAQVAKASEEQRAQYETKFAELAQKLQLAEEKNFRALSMAQQTKRGHVYVISNVGSFGEDVYKIGLTRRLEPFDRVRELGDASVPFVFDVHAMILSDDAPALEHALHRHFLASQLNKVNPRKEFFRASLKTIREEIEKLGIQSSWTMTAAAAEFRQSLAIEKAIRENPASYQAWVNKQLVLEAEVEATEDDLAEAS